MVGTVVIVIGSQKDAPRPFPGSSVGIGTSAGRPAEGKTNACWSLPTSTSISAQVQARPGQRPMVNKHCWHKSQNPLEVKMQTGKTQQQPQPSKLKLAIYSKNNLQSRLAVADTHTHKNNNRCSQTVSESVRLNSVFQVSLVTVQGLLTGQVVAKELKSMVKKYH